MLHCKNQIFHWQWNNAYYITKTVENFFTRSDIIFIIPLSVELCKTSKSRHLHTIRNTWSVLLLLQWVRWAPIAPRSTCFSILTSLNFVIDRAVRKSSFPRPQYPRRLCRNGRWSATTTGGPRPPWAGSWLASCWVSQGVPKILQDRQNMYDVLHYITGRMLGFSG